MVQNLPVLGVVQVFINDNKFSNFVFAYMQPHTITEAAFRVISDRFPGSLCLMFFFCQIQTRTLPSSNERFNLISSENTIWPQVSYTVQSRTLFAHTILRWLFTRPIRGFPLATLLNTRARRSLLRVIIVETLRRVL